MAKQLKNRKMLRSIKMPKTFSFNDFQVTIDFSLKAISSIKFIEEEMIEKPIPFFKIRLRDCQGNKRNIDAFQCDLVASNDQGVFYASQEFDIRLKVEKISQGLVWGINVKNKTSDLIERVELMSLGLFPGLKDDGGKGEINLVYNEGARITSMARREASSFRYYDVDYPSRGIYFMYPNMIASPFMAYIHHNLGLYLGMHDPSHTPKHIDFHIEDGTLKTVFSVFANCDYGEDYEMNFESVMLFFQGDFHDACDIYRAWFYQNEGKKLKKIKDKYDELPNWYHESPVVLTYPIVGTKDMDKDMKPGGLYPYTNALPVVDDYAKQTESPIMVLLMQWESTAPWAPPYVWPPYGDINNFATFRDQLHQNGHYLGLYTSGFGWTMKSHLIDYDQSEKFKELDIQDIVCTNTDGTMISTVVDEIRFGYDICPAMDLSKKFFVDEANKMINFCIDYVQILDQNHGGNPYFCYSDQHGHVPAPGSWQVEETNKLLAMIDKSKCLLGCESAASEPYIDQLMFSDNRFILNYHIGEPIPMYAYLYHEYVNNFMGNQISYALVGEKYSFAYRLAYAFICGDLPTLIIDGEGKMHTAWCNDTIIDREKPLQLIKNANKWRKGKFAKFLHMGKMIKPLKYETNIVKFGFKYSDYIFQFPAVLSSAFELENEEYQFFINYTDQDQIVSLDRKTIEYYDDPNGQLKVSKNYIQVPALNVIVIKL